MGAPNLGFSIDIDSRPYNSVTHYRATLWPAYITVVECILSVCR